MEAAVAPGAPTGAYNVHGISRELRERVARKCGTEAVARATWSTRLRPVMVRDPRPAHRRRRRPCPRPLLEGPSKAVRAFLESVTRSPFKQPAAPRVSTPPRHLSVHKGDVHSLRSSQRRT
eukprot:scaffold1747_cov392-Prasinococcus_capsulatus_cf.AAC.2